MCNCLPFFNMVLVAKPPFFFLKRPVFTGALTVIFSHDSVICKMHGELVTKNIQYHLPEYNCVCKFCDGFCVISCTLLGLLFCAPSLNFSFESMFPKLIETSSELVPVSTTVVGEWAEGCS